MLAPSAEVAALCTAAYRMRISLARCSMTPRYVVMVSSVMPVSPSASRISAALQPILLKIDMMPC